MNVLITGGAGFLGQRLAARLLADARVKRLTLLDRAAPAAPAVQADPRVSTVAGDVASLDILEQTITRETTAIFHLAAVVSGMAEAEFDVGMRANLDATRSLLEVCRSRRHAPKVIFSSSVAVYGGSLPPVVDDGTALTPQTSYGTQKAIGELLVNDYSRRGFVDGRVLRLPTVSVRAGRPNAAASSFASGIIREPLNNEEAICPVAASSRMWLIAPATVTECFVVAHDLPAAAFGPTRSVNLPGLSITVGEMVQALTRVAGPDAAARIRWEEDARIARMVATWPGALDNTRALALGFPSDSDFDTVIRSYMAEQAGSGVFR